MVLTMLLKMLKFLTFLTNAIQETWYCHGGNTEHANVNFDANVFYKVRRPPVTLRRPSVTLKRPSEGLTFRSSVTLRRPPVR